MLSEQYRDLLSGIHVLLVEDDVDAREVATVVLEYCGATVVAARSAREALDTLDMMTPHVLLSDIAMPGDDGFWLLHHVRKHPRGSNIAAIALTGFHDIQRPLAEGFDRAIRKPVDPHVLCEAIARTLGGRRA